MAYLLHKIHKQSRRDSHLGTRLIGLACLAVSAWFGYLAYRAFNFDIPMYTRRFGIRPATPDVRIMNGLLFLCVLSIPFLVAGLRHLFQPEGADDREGYDG